MQEYTTKLKRLKGNLITNPMQPKTFIKNKDETVILISLLLGYPIKILVPRIFSTCIEFPQANQLL